MYKDFWKRMIDFIFSLLALAILWPILLVITIWLHFANKGGRGFLFTRASRQGWQDLQGHKVQDNDG